MDTIVLPGPLCAMHKGRQPCDSGYQGLNQTDMDYIINDWLIFAYLSPQIVIRHDFQQSDDDAQRT